MTDTRTLSWGVVALLAISLLAHGCMDGLSLAENEIFAPLGEPIPSATPEELAAFERGREIALRRFTPEEGLGPTFNTTFCAGCHEKPVFGGGGGHYRDFLLVGVTAPNGAVVGLGNNGVQPQFSLEGGRAPSDVRINISATRNPIPFFGAGLLLEVAEEEILRRADPFDRDGDGISGRVNVDGGFVGRFGRKAQSSSIQSFIRGPLFNHVGITTNPLTPEERNRLPMFRGGVPPETDTTVVVTVGETSGQLGATNVGSAIAAQIGASNDATVDDDDVPDPELSNADLFDLVSFAMLLAPPAPGRLTPTTERGKELFDSIGCASCHVPALPGPRGLIPAYTDLLLHDMGAGLADGFTFGQADGGEFRTQPLWGVVAVAPYLHDGRADTLDEAVRWHGGEAELSQEAYAALSGEDRDAVIAFLESLGGAEQRSDGLLPPGDDAPSEGFGAPLPTLSEEERSLFNFGRGLFDFDYGYSFGLGPAFNGDSCRACHFEPVVGGAGPAGVNAMRQGIIVGDDFVTPAGGTGILRHNTFGTRPVASPEANVFEPRQTPPVFGLGLIEEIPRATIEALADPDDTNMDGISGRAHILGDGRLGRFGWKASIPSIREFVRDALTNELGITVPAEGGMTFGALADEDQVADPEVQSIIVRGLEGFVAGLAPPPANSTDAAIEAEGALKFTQANCTGCHVPDLETAAGEPVPLYSDLLLHDVAEPGAVGIEDGDASIREFRTPPLWGLAASAPYMHDGRASTVEAAINAHDGEAAASRDMVSAMTADDRAALLAFLRSL